MGTKPAPLNVGDRMWLRQNDAMLRPGQACWVLAQVDKPGLCVQIHMDDGSSRPRDIQMADPAGTRRWVARVQLVAFGTATWFRESRAAHAANQAAHQHWLDEQARTPAALEVPDGTQV